MPHFFAEFHPLGSNCSASTGPWLRYDTRIYLDPNARPGRNDSPLAFVVGKNPGSAAPSAGTPLCTLAPLDLNGDKLLPTVLNAFAHALKLRANLGLSKPKGNYIQVLNLFYVCDPSLSGAIRTQRSHSPGFDRPENFRAGIPTWFAWGGDDPNLNGFKGRFLRIATPSIYWDYSGKNTVLGTPGIKTSVKHTQGMRTSDPTFISALAGLL